MFGSLGFTEIAFVLVLALLLFGPKRLPEIGRTIGKGMAEFRRASNDLRRTLEREVQLDDLQERANPASAASQAATLRPLAVERPAPETAPPAAESRPEPEAAKPAPEEPEAEPAPAPEAPPAAAESPAPGSPERAG